MGEPVSNLEIPLCSNDNILHGVDYHWSSSGEVPGSFLELNILLSSLKYPKYVTSLYDRFLSCTQKA